MEIKPSKGQKKVWWWWLGEWHSDLCLFGNAFPVTAFGQTAITMRQGSVHMANAGCVHQAPTLQLDRIGVAQDTYAPSRDSSLS